jgi:hypothetical protein
MIDVARHSYPGFRFETSSMTDLRLADASVAGLLSFWSLVHTPDDEFPAILAASGGSCAPAARCCSASTPARDHG